MTFSTIKVDSFDLILKRTERGWLYRGQRSVDWPLKTSLERCCEREKTPLGKERALLEKRLLRQFRRAYHHYSGHVPAPEHALEWLALMQHHGAPTRLLDFTYSLYVATYFAIEDAIDEDCVVWAVNGRWALNESIRLMKSAGRSNADVLKEQYEERHMGLVPDFFLDQPAVPCACPQNPFTLNERLRIQKGVFLIPGSIAIPFEENLCAMPGSTEPSNVVRLVISCGLRRDFLRRLFEMNISRTSLFPGLDGYARSLGVYDPEFEQKPWSE